MRIDIKILEARMKVTMYVSCTLFENEPSLLQFTGRE